MKRGAPNHPNVQELAEALKIQHYAAVGLLEMLWQFAAEDAPTGDLSHVSRRTLAKQLKWDGKPSDLFDALLAKDWLERVKKSGYAIHDWADYCDPQVHIWLVMQGKKFWDGQKPSLTRLSKAERAKISSTKTPAARKRLAIKQLREYVNDAQTEIKDDPYGDLILFARGWQDRHNGTPFSSVNIGRDLKDMARAREVCHGDTAPKDLFADFFALEDSFIKNTRVYCVSEFLRQIPALIARKAPRARRRSAEEEARLAEMFKKKGEQEK